MIPIGMSLAALVIVVGHVAIYGAAREPDEGAAAHIFQLLMAGQVPVIIYYAIKWLPRDARGTIKMLGLQVGAAIAAIAPVWFLGL